MHEHTYLQAHKDARTRTRTTRTNTRTSSTRTCAGADKGDVARWQLRCTREGLAGFVGALTFALRRSLVLPLKGLSCWH
jgi:hypothetical protein